MAEFLKIPVKFSGSRTVSVGAGSATTSDAFIYSGNAMGGVGTFKANNAGTPTAGDTVDFYLLASAGDPDGSDLVEFSSEDTTHAIYIATLDTLVTDPAIRTANVPAFEQGKIRIVNNAASAVTASAVLKEMIL